MAAPGLRSRGVRRTGWVVGDQALSGLTNVVATVVVARSVSPGSFGAFSVGFIVYILALGVVRGLVSQPFAVRLSTAALSRKQMAGATGAALVVGAAIGLAMALSGLVLRGDIGAVLMVVGVLLPGLLLQDTWRFVAFTAGRPGRAASIDVVWAVLQAVLMGGVVLLDGGLVALTAAWAAAGALAAVVGTGQTGVRPDLRLAVPFLRRHADIGPLFATEFVLHTGSSQVATLMLGGLIGAVGIGAIRGGQTLFGPCYVVMIGLMAAAVPEGARMLARAPGRVLPLLRTMSGALAALSVAWGVTIAVLPDAWGTALLGSTWEGAERLVVPLTVAAAGNGLASGALTGLRIVAAAGAILRVRAVVGGLTIVGGVVGGAVGDVDGAMWGIGVGTCGTAVGAWWALRQTFDRQDADTALGVAV